jgi:outer membrane protein assembly factor BamD
MKESFNAFKELEQKFPDGRYSEDARARMRYLSNALGMYEVHVARYYFNRGAYVAAVNRGQAALVNYPRTPSNEAALDILVRGYERLRMQKLADDSRRILQATFPESAYLNPAPEKPWWKLW